MTPQESLVIARQRMKEKYLNKYNVDHHWRVKEIYNKALETNRNNHNGVLGWNSDIQKITMKKKYNVDCIFKSKDFIEYNKNLQKKRYKGVGFQSKYLREKSENTRLIRYNDKNYNNREKSVKTSISKYGSKNYNNREKSRETCMERYNVSHQWKSKEIRNKISKTMVERYGVPYSYMLVKSKISKINIKFSELLNENNIKNSFEFSIGKCSYDIKLEDYNILIEINPTITHNSTEKCPWNSKYSVMDKNYHLNKTKLAEDNGYHCIHIFDWDNWRDIISLIHNIINNDLKITNKYIEIINNNFIKIDNSKISYKDFKDYDLVSISDPVCHKINFRDKILDVYDCGFSLITLKKNIKERND